MGVGEGGRCVDGADELAHCGQLPRIDGVNAWLNTPGEQPLADADRAGKVNLVDFWAYSCINCQRSIPGIQRLHETYGDLGLQVIGQQIEDPQAAAAMWMGGIDYIQGNLVSSVGSELDFDFQNAVL